MKKTILPVVLCSLALTALAFGQTGTAVTAPEIVVAGGNITITVIVDRAPSIERTYLTVRLSPKEPTDNAAPFEINLAQKSDEPTVYTTITEVPPKAKGKWFIEQVRVGYPLGNPVTLETNHPEFSIKPTDVKLPSSGKVEVKAR